ncbi:spore germination protein [Alkalithermobacter thermoalcaliphilus JW-YL-7 = DSM 7308]|uniref:Spore germination protein n=1 Tax=Alkalithermobacter thermoalcaliphilus JW-YL-7 = DSM 7308 TaxID=1121328 RepID=A0A150FML5_CLOPD|nr:spore germination protein [[Clostridium] paradoxum JW-YL-7 = DSM 7308]SHL21899.1 spore germination protein [[Clostridium] paradoxum JW-YL-7 = DSM 7308]
MISSKEKITTSQAITFLMVCIIGSGTLTLPRVLVDEVGGDGLLVLIISTAIMLSLGYCVYKVISYFPNKSFIQIASILLTKPVAYVLSFMYIITYIIFGSVIFRILAEVTKMYMLRNTPTEVIIITMLIVSLYAIRAGIEPVARLSQIFIPLTIIPIVLVILPELRNADFSNLLPFFQSSPLSLATSVRNVVFSFAGFEIMLLIGVFLSRPSRGFEIQYKTIIPVGLFYIFIFISSVALFGQVEVTHMLWPTLTLVKLIDIPGAFLQNLDAVVMASWVILIFMSIVLTMYSATIMMTDLLNSKEHSYLVMPLAPIIYFLALYPSNLAQLYDMFSHIAVIVLETTIIIITPIILYLSLLIKKRVGKI